MPISLPSISLVYALLILVPGFLSYKIARKVGKITTETDRFDKIIYTVIGSGISFSFLVLIYSQVTNYTIQEIPESNFGITELSFGYLAMLLIASIIGGIVGVIVNHGLNRGEDIRGQTSWQLIAENKKEPAKVRVVMNNNSEIWGEILITDSEPHGQDIFLRYPMKVIRDETGKVVDEIGIGEYVFLSQTDISHIYFETDVSI